ncbi:MAG TPA: GNAT family N-acetyltransferase [Anaerolineales bacterium]|nr:GNAT family N-acetyltransferase [Anaerolineales bacterium]
MAVDYEAALAAVQADPRYRANIRYGVPRSGHPEGSIAAHILNLEANLEQIRGRLTPEAEARLRFAIHVHDTFKSESRATDGARDHGAFARDFAAEFVDDPDMLALLELHDEPYRLWKGWMRTGELDSERLGRLAEQIDDWDQFLAFVILDSWTAGKSLEKLRWFIRAALAVRRSAIDVGWLPPYIIQNHLHELGPEDLGGFFDGWPKPPTPETHLRILEGSDRVWLARVPENGQVAGFITALTDGVLSAYIPLLEVLPAHRGRGVGGLLTRILLADLSELYMIDLVCDAELQPFYARQGFRPGQAMSVRRYGLIP